MTFSFSVRDLTLNEVRGIYGERLVRDFPVNEIKPLSAIEAMMRRGEYACYAASDGGETLAYAFFVCLNGDETPVCLFDYLAVREDLRGSGVGGAFLEQLMAGPLRAYACVLLEVDDPDFAADDREKAVWERRLRFYRHHGLTDTGVRANVYGADFRILELPVAAPHAASDARDIYCRLYRRMMPPAIYRSKVRITGMPSGLADAKTSTPGA